MPIHKWLLNTWTRLPKTGPQTLSNSSNPNSLRTRPIRELPVAALAGAAEELVGVENHDLVLVGLLHHDALHLRCVGHHERESIPYHPEHALHLEICRRSDWKWQSQGEMWDLIGAPGGPEAGEQRIWRHQVAISKLLLRKEFLFRCVSSEVLFPSCSSSKVIAIWRLTLT